MNALVYGLCAATSFLCAVLLLRRYFRTKTRLLLWSGICFSLLVVGNLVLYIDLIIVPTIDLSTARSAAIAISSVVLLIGLIWETT